MLRFLYEYMSNIVEFLEELGEEMVETVFKFFEFVLKAILLILTPIWIIPFLIYKNRK
jgi:hypothetical protein